MTDTQVEQALVKQPGMPMTRAKLSIPFIGKDVPSPSSEFAHPDITIGLTLLSFRYEGLRMSDFDAVLDLLVANLEAEPGVAAERPTAMLFKRWVEGSGGVLATRRQELQDRRPACVRARACRRRCALSLSLSLSLSFSFPLSFSFSLSLSESLCRYKQEFKDGQGARNRQDLTPEELAAARAAEVREKKAGKK